MAQRVGPVSAPRALTASTAVTAPTTSSGMPLRIFVPVARTVSTNGRTQPVLRPTVIRARSHSAAAPHSAAGASLVIWLLDATMPGHRGRSSAPSAAYRQPIRNSRSAR